MQIEEIYKIQYNEIEERIKCSTARAEWYSYKVTQLSNYNNTIFGNVAKYKRNKTAPNIELPATLHMYFNVIANIKSHWFADWLAEQTKRNEKK